MTKCFGLQIKGQDSEEIENSKPSHKGWLHTINNSCGHLLRDREGESEREIEIEIEKETERGGVSQYSMGIAVNI